jgi:uncharacterized protein (TIGR00645 family)
MNIWAKRAGKLMYASRWVNFPLGLGMILVLIAYVIAVFAKEISFLFQNFHMNVESWALLGLSFVDAYMIANLMQMVAQGSFQIFIQRFDIPDPSTRAQYLDHLDSGLLKVKVSQSIGGIMFVELLQNFIHIHDEPWIDIQHRLIVFAIVVIAALVFAVIWRVTHPSWQNGHTPEEENHS